MNVMEVSKMSKDKRNYAQTSLRGFNNPAEFEVGGRVQMYELKGREIGFYSFPR